MYALVDCNNFYASCERLFQPHLVGKPVAILSNNDGCIISRSDEARASPPLLHLYLSFLKSATSI